MGYKITSAEWRSMSAEHRGLALDAFVEAAMGPPNGELEEISEAIKKHEYFNEMSTEQMLDRLEAGCLTESAHITEWLMLVRRRDLIAANAKKSTQV